jgi:hypothetical protein
MTFSFQFLFGQPNPIGSSKHVTDKCQLRNLFPTFKFHSPDGRQGDAERSAIFHISFLSGQPHSIIDPGKGI